MLNWNCFQQPKENSLSVLVNYFAWNQGPFWFLEKKMMLSVCWKLKPSVHWHIVPENQAISNILWAACLGLLSIVCVSHRWKNKVRKFHGHWWLMSFALVHLASLNLIPLLGGVLSLESKAFISYVDSPRKRTLRLRFLWLLSNRISGYNLHDLVQEAKTRWLKPAEVLFVLQNHTEDQLTHEPAQKPTSNLLFGYIFNVTLNHSAFTCEACCMLRWWFLSHWLDSLAGGSLFLFNKRVLRFFRKDGHSWRKKKDGRTVGEAHERLKVCLKVFL